MTLPPQRSARAFNDLTEMMDYLVPAALGGNKRGVIDSIEGGYQAALFALGDVNTAQNAFDLPQDTISLAAATRYGFEMYLDLDTGATTHTTGLLFALSGGLTLTRIKYWTIATSGAVQTLATPQMGQWEVATASVVTATSTAVSTQIIARGTLVTLAAGALTPQIIFSAAPGGAPNSTAADSFYRFWRLGTAAEVAIGNVG